MAEDEPERNRNILTGTELPTRDRLGELLAGFDPEKHRHELMLDGDPAGAESI